MAISNPCFVLNPSVIHQSFHPQDTLPLLPDSLWYIERGVVRTVTWDDEGTIVTLGYWGAQDVVGQPIPHLEPYEIQCLTSVQASFLPKALWAQAIDAIVKQKQQTEELMSIIGLNPAWRRLWAVLMFLSQKFGRDIEQGRLIELKLSHRELAELTKLTRVTVTRILQQFEAQGKLLRFSPGRFVISSSAAPPAAG